MSESRIRVLVAEDNPTDSILLKESLMGVDSVEFAVTFVDCLADAVKALQNGEFDAVLMDLGLPDSNGLDTFLGVREHARSAVVIVLTGLEDEETGIKAVQMGAEDYLTKGHVRTSLLGRIIRYAIERSELKRKLEEKREREAHDREVRSIEQLSAASTQVTAAMYASGALRESMPEEFARLAGEYSRLLDLSLDLRTYKTERTLSEDLREMANDLGLVRASPRDVVEIHSGVLKDKIKGLPTPKAQAFLEEGRLTILELMGCVASFYRNLSASPVRKGTPR